MPLYIVETVQMFKHTYAIQCEKGEYAEDYVTCEEVEEFGQKSLGETITSVREVTTSEYLEQFDEISDYLKSWCPAQKMRFIKNVANSTHRTS
jgi:hypothetical protein